LDRVDHRIAAVLLANFAGLFLDERREGIKIARNLFPGLLLGFGQRIVEGFNLLLLSRGAGALHRERLIARRARPRVLCIMAEAIDLMLSFVLFGNAHALHGEDLIRWPAIALFANSHFLAPEVGLNRIALRHLVVPVALRKTHPRAIAELAN